ncbi:hypothetical protein [Citrobacter portucalensis]|uniref:hypothetical protein n=1 Tax=Citrobacter portucalensis TaxID=1639133 RepID=UPI00226BA44A|nr:hypothetical protein [Citrobacter portucalensis]MCX8984244.1 hypothetical protein [Citrobacter portucalensis]
MLHEPLAREIMRVAAEHNLRAGDVLPEKAFDLLLDENPETIGEALMELYLTGLLEEIPHEVDRLTQAGSEFIASM